MKRALALAATLVGWTSLASGADLPARLTSPTAPPAAAPAAAWSGYYVGATVGAAAARLSTMVDFRENLFDPGDEPRVGAAGTGHSTTTRAVGGIRAGMNLQMNQIVLGLEADLETGPHSRRSSTGTYIVRGPRAYDFAFAQERNSDLTATLATRLGYSAGPVLAYGLVGISAARGSFASHWDDTGFHGSSGYDVIDTRGRTDQLGAVFGGGVEYAVTGPWSARVEYRHTAFAPVHSTAALTGALPGTAPVPHKLGMSSDAVTIGVDYRFR